MAERREISEDTAERIVHILGDSCAMRLALADYRARKADGQDAAIYQIGEGIFVGPPLTPNHGKG
jgi:hypothetical protein